MSSKTRLQDHSAEPISGHKGRDRWICAILTRDDLLTPLELRVAIRLGIFFNCNTGQCDPGYGRLAKELCIPQRSARRAVAALVEYGFIGRDEGAGGRHDQKRNFSLFMPSARGTDDVSSVRGTASESPVETEKKDENGGQERGVTGDQNKGEQGTIRGPRKEPDEPEEPDSAALRAARTSRADRERATETGSADDAPPSQRAAEAALIETDVTEQPSPPPNASTENIGPAARADAEPGFRDVLREYPSNCIGDEAKAYWVFDDKMAGWSLSDVVKEVAEFVRERGANVPPLAEALMIIARRQVAQERLQ